MLVARELEIMESVEMVSSMMEKLSTYSFLSEDFVFKEILTKVPVKSLMRFKCVSKSWLSHITSDANFIAEHTDHHSKTSKPSTIIRKLNSSLNVMEISIRFYLLDHRDSNPEEISISYIKRALNKKRPENKASYIYLVGSCKGLVCLNFLFYSRRNRLVLWNPATRMFHCLPEALPLEATPGTYSTRYPYEEHCFGYDEVSNDYKVIRVLRFVMTDGMRESVLEVQLFTKSSGHWRRLRSLSGLNLTSNIDEGVTVEGVMHWLMVHSPIPAKGSIFHLLTFDIRSEELKEIDGPTSRSDDMDYNQLKLIKWKGCLGAVTTVEKEFEVWSKGRDGSGNWIKMVTIGAPCWIVFRGVLWDRFLFLDISKRQHFLYEPVSEETRVLFSEELEKMTAYNFQDYVPTIVSLN